MADQKISSLNELATTPADDDELAIVDTSATETKKITRPNLLGDLDNLTSAEITQLENINSVTITNAQWGYLGALDQGLTSSSSPTFDALTVTSIGGITQGNLLDKSAAETVSGDWTFTGFKRAISHNASIPDDDFTTFDPGSNRCFFVVTTDGSQSFVGYNLYNSLVSIAEPGYLESILTNGTLDGTTGTDGFFTVRVYNGTIYVENRRGATRSVQIAVLG